MIVIGITLLVALVALTGWNAVTNRELLKLRRLKQVELPDSKYYELKYKMQFLVTMFAVFAALASLYGYTTLEDAKKTIVNEFNDSIDSLRLTLKRTSKIVNEKDSIAKDVNQRIGRLSGSIPQLATNIQLLEKRIESINQKNILKQNYYIVSSIGFIPSDKPAKILLKDLRTNHGDKLPQFVSPPLIIPISEGGVVLDVGFITVDSFQVGYSSFFEGAFTALTNPNDPIKFSVLILEK